MERQIKFRGKRFPDGKWVYGDLLRIGGGCIIYYGSKTDTQTPDIPKESDVFVELFNNEVAVVIPDTVGQFTGLLDCDGNEIYEGDILKGRTFLHVYDLPDGEQFDYEGFVEWGSQCDVGLCWQLTDLEKTGSWWLKKTVHRIAVDYSTGRIIGNIHDNRELLKYKL